MDLEQAMEEPDFIFIGTLETWKIRSLCYSRHGVKREREMGSTEKEQKLRKRRLEKDIKSEITQWYGHIIKKMKKIK